MRENVKTASLIIALIVSSVSLPIGIMGFNKQPVIYNYYTDNYYTNNTTTIINNNTTIINGNITAPKLEPYYIQESFTVLNLTDNPDWFLDVSYNLTEGYEIFFKGNSSDYFNIKVFYVQDYLFDFWDTDRDNIFYYNDPDFYSNDGMLGWTPPTSGIWYFCFRYEHLGGLGVDITIEITHYIMI